jgi:hypothetical protein
VYLSFILIFKTQVYTKLDAEYIFLLLLVFEDEDEVIPVIFFNGTPRHEDVLGSGSITPHVF